MTWNIIVRVGDEDTFWPKLTDEEPRIVVPIHRQGDPWAVSNNLRSLMEEHFLIPPQGIAADLVHLAVAIFTADVRVDRRFGEDKWAREFLMYLPVSDVSVWERAQSTLKGAIEFLTGDSWEFVFRRKSGKRSAALKPKPVSADAVCLFSGGLDSLVGAIDLLAEGKRVALVGHHGAGLTNSFQQQTLRVLEGRFDDQILPFMFSVQPPKNKREKVKGSKTAPIRKKRTEAEGEQSMRSRSILFLSLGTAVAESLTGDQTLVVAENGLISLNVPLTQTRSGSLSTRTTHPHFIARFQGLLEELGLKARISMPYRFQTKGEMLRQAKDQDALNATAPLTMSCSHTEAGRFGGFFGKHCGYCVPCIIRRASTTAANVQDGFYKVDPRKRARSPAKPSGRDVRAFQMALERLSGEGPHAALFDVLSTGPLPPPNAVEYAEVYRRGMAEVQSFLGGSKVRK